MALRITYVIDEPRSGLARHQSLVAQWFEHPTGVWKVIRWNPVGYSDFFSLSHARDMMI